MSELPSYIDPRWKKVGEILNTVSSKTSPAEEAILAGGAVRDFLNDKPIKDFDFYVSYSGSKTPPPQLTVAGVEFAHVKNPDYDESNLAVYTSICNNYQLMITPMSQKEILDSFDINICKCYYQPGKGFVTTPEYDDGIKNKEIIYDISQQTTSNHLKRVIEKYPDFRTRPASKNMLRGLISGRAPATFTSS